MRRKLAAKLAPSSHETVCFLFRFLINNSQLVLIRPREKLTGDSHKKITTSDGYLCFGGDDRRRFWTASQSKLKTR